jgi:hypothetical protein
VGIRGEAIREAVSESEVRKIQETP